MNYKPVNLLSNKIFTKKTMKKSLFALTLAIISFTAKAQNECWYYSYQNFGITGYVKIEKTSDTVIESKLCKVLLKTSFTYDEIFDHYDTTIFGKEYIFTNNDTVFRYKYSKFYSLYILTLI